ncbi:hypothetical protein CBR_g31279 [Chara braunii]|uniref:Peptidase A2 domain-containing protein n=1 Tax=Chara braunii TaxID=69332 RepID=A0A388LEJ1_CHABU|nr:hypothetical protein CBR_g31279 [Chara braunii]|eukprot:GBG80725.1 hypothetical protein CBR_g31279 [Chara braunii]
MAGDELHQADGVGQRSVTFGQLVALQDGRAVTRSNIPKVQIFHFKGDKVSEWLELLEQITDDMTEEEKFRQISKYVWWEMRSEVMRVATEAAGKWGNFKAEMQRRYQLGDSLLTTEDLERLERSDFTTVGAFATAFEKMARKVPGLAEESQCAIFLSNFTECESVSLTRRGTIGRKLTWETVKQSLADGELDQVYQFQMKQQRQKRMARVVSEGAVTRPQAKAAKKVVEQVEDDDDDEEEEPVKLTKSQRKARNQAAGGKRSGKNAGVQVAAAAQVNANQASTSGAPPQGPAQLGPWPGAIPPVWPGYSPYGPWPFYNQAGPPAGGPTANAAGGYPSVPTQGVNWQGGAQQQQPTPPPQVNQPSQAAGQGQGHNQGGNGQSNQGRGNGGRGRGNDNGGQSGQGGGRGVNWNGQGGNDRPRFDWRNVICHHCALKGHTFRFCQIRKVDEGNGLISTNMDGDVYDMHEKYIDAKIAGGMRKEALQRAELGLPPPTMFRLWQEEDVRMASVRLGGLIPAEAHWAVPGTKMDWKSVGTGSVNLSIKGKPCSGMLDTGAEMNIIKESDALRLGMDIDRMDSGFLYGTSGKTPFTGTTSNVVIEIGKVKVRSCFFVMPDLDHPLLLGRSFLYRTESMILSKHDDTMYVILSDPVCGNYEIIACHNTGPCSLKNRPNPGSCTFEESEGERRRLMGEDEEECEPTSEMCLSLTSINDAMEIVSSYGMTDPIAVEALRERIVEDSGEGEVELVYRLPARTKTDAGPTALGGILIQVDANGEERLLRFESRTLNGTERNYSQFKRETLAVLHCLRVFRNYLFGRRFVLRVDPTTLVSSLKNYAPSDPTIARWLTYVWMFDFELERIPGNKNRANGLSRINWDKFCDGVNEDIPPVDAFLDEEEDVKLHINAHVIGISGVIVQGQSTFLAPAGYVNRADIVLNNFVEENPWGGKNVEWMAKLALAETFRVGEDPMAIESGAYSVDAQARYMADVSFLVNSIVQVHEDGEGSQDPVRDMEEDEFEEREITEAFRADEYEGVYRELVPPPETCPAEIGIRDRGAPETDRTTPPTPIRDGEEASLQLVLTIASVRPTETDTMEGVVPDTASERPYRWRDTRDMALYLPQRELPLMIGPATIGPMQEHEEPQPEWPRETTPMHDELYRLRVQSRSEPAVEDDQRGAMRPSSLDGSSLLSKSQLAEQPTEPEGSLTAQLYDMESPRRQMRQEVSQPSPMDMETERVEAEVLGLDREGLTEGMETQRVETSPLDFGDIPRRDGDQAKASMREHIEAGTEHTQDASPTHEEESLPESRGPIGHEPTEVARGEELQGAVQRIGALERENRELRDTVRDLVTGAEHARQSTSRLEQRITDLEESPRRQATTDVVDGRKTEEQQIPIGQAHVSHEVEPGGVRLDIHGETRRHRSHLGLWG